MIIWLRRILSLAFVSAGLIALFIMLSTVIQTANRSKQANRDGSADATIVHSYVSVEPFGEATNVVERDSQIFYNMQIQRIEGRPCYVRTSWRWVLHLPTGNTVMWNKSDGEFYAGDKNENLAQAVQVPAQLIPGDYTLSRLSRFKCGDVEDYANTVRNIDIHVGEKKEKKTVDASPTTR